jgi:hypothetical protein
MAALSLPQVHMAGAHPHNTSCSAQAKSRRISKEARRATRKARKFQKEPTLSEAVISRRAAAAALGTKKAQKLEKRRSGLAMIQHDTSDAASLPEGKYVTAILAMLPVPDEDSNVPKKGSSRGRGKRRELQMQRVRLHKEYMLRGVEAEFEEEWRESETRLHCNPCILQVRF